VTLSKVMGMGRAVARVSRLIFLTDWRMVIKIFKKRYSVAVS
jgi:hypothetical protein